MEKLSLSEIENLLDTYLEPVLSSRRTSKEPANIISLLDHRNQQFVMNWIKITSNTNAEISYQFTLNVQDVLNNCGQEGTKTWILKVLDVYDKTGLYSALSELYKVQEFILDWKYKSSGVSYNKISRILETFLQGLNGRKLIIETSDVTFTDTEKIYLPESINIYDNEKNNYNLYKATTIHLWSQNWYGTWSTSLKDLLDKYPDKYHALDLFYFIETIRLNSLLKRDYPGFYNLIITFNKILNNNLLEEFYNTIQMYFIKTNKLECNNSIKLLEKFYNKIKNIQKFNYQGVLLYNQVDIVRKNRILREKQIFQNSINRAIKGKDKKHTSIVLDYEKTGISIKKDKLTLNQKYHLYLDGKKIKPFDNIDSVINSIIQDIGKIPEDYLEPAGDALYNLNNNNDNFIDNNENKPLDNCKSFKYDEWDYNRRQYKKNWCILNEQDLQDINNDFITNTLNKYSLYIKKIKNIFTIAKEEEKYHRKQFDGQELDIDSLIDYLISYKIFPNAKENFYMKLNKTERNIAVLFLVDMSGSTKGWVNEFEREALIILCECLKILNDNFAIYGFSGITRKKCDFYKIKTFKENYNELIQQRINAISPKDYTRMGVGIRHSIQILNKIKAKSKLLFILSDGKPEDYDEYRGIYGIEDTRKSFTEALYYKIHPFCITIDKNSSEYLPDIFGTNYFIIDQIKKLPYKLIDIYKKITNI